MSLKLAFAKCYPIREYSVIANPLISMPSLSYETTTLPNKLVVASADINSPIVRVSIAYKSGSRDESLDNLGSSHVVRVASGLSTKRSTSFGIIRNLQQYGLKMYTEHGRETFMYTLESHRDNIEKGVNVFEDVACNAAFKPWEIPELIPRLNQELNERTHVTKVMDNLHKAAFRYGLGNSIYASKYFLRNLDSENLMHYFYSNFVPSRTVVLGHGIPHDELLKFAQNLPICENSKCSNPERIASKFHSGEIRFDKGGSLATFAIATQGASIKNRKEYLALCVLRQILGVGSKLKWASESGSILAKNIEQRPEINVSAFNFGYSDNGLFGVLASCPAEKANKVAQAIYKTLKTGKVSEKDVRRGKNQVIASFLLKSESLKTHLTDSAEQLLKVGKYQSNDSLVSDIESLTDSDINNVAKKITTSKLAMSSYGRIHNVPFLDELK